MTSTVNDKMNRPDSATPLRVVVGPDYRKPNSYQMNLDQALRSQNVHLDYSSAKGKLLPIFGDLRRYKPDIFHLHWPEGYFRRLSNISPRLAAFFPLEEARYLMDLQASLRLTRAKLVLTAHNLWPHQTWNHVAVRFAMRTTAALADAIIVHSAAAAVTVEKEWNVGPEKISVIPHGDLSGIYGDLPTATSARKELPVPDDLPLMLMFGVLDPYKGVDEVIEIWKKHNPPARLVVVGHSAKPGLVRELQKLAEGSPRIHLFLGERLPEDRLRLWLASADGVIFNHRRSLTSGAASLVRSLGLPILIHERLDTVDLAEPHLSVCRFGVRPDDFGNCLALLLQRNAGVRLRDSNWLETTSWQRVAAETIKVYRTVLGGS